MGEKDKLFKVLRYVFYLVIGIISLKLLIALILVVYLAITCPF